MRRTSATQFLDHSENSQRMLDMDLFPEWERMREEKERLRIRKGEYRSKVSIMKVTDFRTVGETRYFFAIEGVHDHGCKRCFI